MRLNLCKDHLFKLKEEKDTHRGFEFKKYLKPLLLDSCFHGVLLLFLILFFFEGFSLLYLLLLYVILLWCIFLFPSSCFLYTDLHLVEAFFVTIGLLCIELEYPFPRLSIYQFTNKKSIVEFLKSVSMLCFNVLSTSYMRCVTKKTSYMRYITC